MADTALALNPDGSISMRPDGSAILTDPDNPHCCECPADLLCAACGCTPATWSVTIPAQVIPTGCWDCANFFGGDGSWNITGAYGGDTYCLVQVSECQWLYDAPFTGVVAKFYEANGCAGTRCYETSRLQVVLDITGGNVTISAFIYTASFDCGNDPTSPGVGVALFYSFLPLSDFTEFCKRGGDHLSNDPAGRTNCGSIPINDFLVIFTTLTTATSVPCCDGDM